MAEGIRARFSQSEVAWYIQVCFSKGAAYCTGGQVGGCGMLNDVEVMESALKRRKFFLAKSMFQLVHTEFEQVSPRLVQFPKLCECEVAEAANCASIGPVHY